MRIAVVSCYKYRAAWYPFLYFFRKFWPTCIHDLFLVTDRFEPFYGQPDNIFEYNSPHWSKVLLAFVRTYPSEPIMLFLEDYFLTEPVNTSLIHESQYLFGHIKPACLRLYPCPDADVDIDRIDVGEIKPRAPYRVSTQVAIWDPETLAYLALRTNTPQEFELEGTRLVENYPKPFLSWKRESPKWPLHYICTGIVRGVWQKDAIEHCRKHGVEPDLTGWPVQG